MLVGRDAELTIARELLGDAGAGRGACLFVRGEAGSGKTRLLGEIERDARERGMTALAAGVPAGLAPPAFGVLAQALRSWTRENEVRGGDLEPFAPGLHQIIPEWPATDAPPDLSPDQLRLLVMEGALRLVIATAGRHGCLVVLDDLHVADPETLQFVYQAVRSIGDYPVVLLAAIRTHENRSVEADAAAIVRAGLARAIELTPLGAESVTAMAAAILGAPPPGGLVAELMARTDGVPLLVEEVLQAHLSAGTLIREGGALRWTAEARTPVSRTVLDLVRPRLARLSTQARRLVAAGAVLGRFDVDLLGAVAGQDQGGVGPLDEAVEAGVLETAESRLAFRHALIREAVTAALMPDERAGLHSRAADAISRLRDEDPVWLEDRAHHLEAIGERRGAAELLVSAGRSNLAAQAPASAETALRRALDLSRATDVEPSAADALAEALGLLGRWEEALALDSETEGRHGGSADRLARMARNAVSAGRLDEAQELIRRAAEAGAPAGPLRALSALLALWRGELEAAIRLGGEALELGGRAGSPEVVCQALDAIGRAADASGRRERAADAFGRWAAVAEGAGLTMSRLQALMELGNLDFLSGGAADGLRQARELAMRTSAFPTLVLADLSLVWWLGHRALIQEAISLGEEAVALCRHFGLGLLPHAVMATAWARSRADFTDGARLVDEALAMAPEDPDLAIIGEWTRGDAALRAGSAGEAADHYERGLLVMRATPSGVPPPVPFMKVCALAVAGRHEEARSALEEARAAPILPRLYVNPFWLAVGESLVARSLEDLETALRGAQDNGTFNRAVALVFAAESIAGPRAESWLREALSIFEHADIESDAARVRRMLRSMGASVPRRRRAAPDLPETLRDNGITRREAEVLALVGQGLSNAEIAQRLFLSVRTVESHVSSLMLKLDRSSRAGLIALSLSLGPGV